MQYTIKPHPTRYNGTLFRSRLEARWAAFFDLLGWSWEYEPLDFDGWVPDFILSGREQTAVEVKPIIGYQSFNPKSHDWTGKIERFIKGTGNNAIIVGASIEALPCSATSFGILSECSEVIYEKEEFIAPNWGSAIFAENPDKSIDFTHAECSYHHRMSGHYDGGSSFIYDPSPIKFAWAEAGNRTRWRA